MTITGNELRDLTRAAFHTAALTAPTEGGRLRFVQASQQYEVLWQAVDNAQRKAAAEQAQAAQQPPTSTPPSAVETDGIDSDKAQQKRDERRTRRLAEAQAKQEAAAKKEKGTEPKPPDTPST